MVSRKSLPSSQYTYLLLRFNRPNFSWANGYSVKTLQFLPLLAGKCGHVIKYLLMRYIKLPESFLERELPFLFHLLPSWSTSSYLGLQ